MILIRNVDIDINLYYSFYFHEQFCREFYLIFI